MKVDVAQLVQEGVSVPYCGEYLASRVKVLLDKTLAYTAALCRQEAISEAVGKYLEDRDGVGNVAKVGSDTQPGGEFSPLAPGSLVGVDAGGRHTVCHFRAHRTVAMCCIVVGGGWQICQDLSWGTWHEK